MHAEAPNSLLYNFDGYLEHDNVKHPLTASQLLLRGAVLKNTAEVFGTTTTSQCARRRHPSLTTDGAAGSRTYVQASFCLPAKRPRCG